MSIPRNDSRWSPNQGVFIAGLCAAAEGWWLTAGALFQTVWNIMDGTDPGAGIRDYDLFYFDEGTSYEAEEAVIRRAQILFKDLDEEAEVRHEARVHLWYEEHFGILAKPFTRTADAIDHFAAKTCCFAVTADDKSTSQPMPHTATMTSSPGRSCRTLSLRPRTCT